jgi:3-dehydroquinate synthase
VAGMGSESVAVIQRIEVGFDTPVHFTRNLFDPANPVLAQVMQPAHGRAPKLLVAVEAGLLDHHPDLCERIIAYARRHELQLVEAPVLLEGGEVIKRSWDGAQRVLEAINRGDIDRHSYVVAVGGGAFLDAVGFAAAIAHRGVG